MITTVHEVYPSSNVAPEVIADFGWEFVEGIPTITNEVGRLAPTPERSALHTALRDAIEASGKLEYQTADGETVIARDFAVALDPTDTQMLGFFALR